MSSTPRSLFGYTSRGDPVIGEDDPNSRTRTPLSTSSKSTPVCPKELTRALLARRRTETDPRILSADLLTSDEDDQSRYQSSTSLEWLNSNEWDHDFDLHSKLVEGWRRRGMLRSPPLSRRSSVSATDSAAAGGSNPERPPPPRPTPPPPVGQVTNSMAATDRDEARVRATNEAKMAVMTAVSAWADDYEDLDVNDVPICMMKQKIEEIDELKKVLQSHEPRLLLAGLPTYPNELKEQVKGARKGLSLLSRNLMKALAAYEELNRAAALNPAAPTAPPAPPADGAISAAPAAAPSAAIKTPIVQDNLSLVIAQVDSMIEAMDELRDEPSDEREYRLYISRSAAAFRQSETVKAFASQVVNEAASCNLVNEMTRANTKLSELRSSEDVLRTAERRARATFGAVGDSGREYISKPPQFSGDQDKGADFFTFRRDWDEFKKQAHASQSKLLHILINESLTGTAKAACRELESEELVFKRLSKIYGNVAFLIQTKIEEIQKLKRCDGPTIRRREWLIEVSSKMIAVRDLAVKHGKEEKVYHSVLAEHVTQALPPSWQENFRVYARKKHGLRESDDEDDEDEDDDDHNVTSLSMKSLYETLIKFLLSKVKKSTFDIDYELSVNKSREKDRTKPDPPAASKPKASKAYAVGESTPVAAAAQSGGTGQQSRDGAGKTEKGAKKERSRKKPAKQPPVATVTAAAYSTPAEQKCPWCKGSHTHAYYCTEFQNTAALLRMKKCYDAKICFKCLRLDSKVRANDKDWSKQHRKDCNTDWLCNIDNCANKVFYRRPHFLLCGFHTAENESVVGEFIKQLDQGKLPPSVKFFTCYPVFFKRPSEETPIHVAIDGYDVEPDVVNNSIFMCQTLRVGEEELLLFYDSGCLGAGISDRAAILLKSTCVREGPTNMDVAGGGTVTIKHGDEQFALPLVGDRKMCLVTGIRMDEITSPFPLWDIDQAWPAIHDEFLRACPGKTLPARPAKVGGRSVDLMLGIRYIKHFPVLLYNLPSGLAIYESKIAAADGRNLVLAGPHASWNRACSQINLHSAHVFFSQEMRAFYYNNLTLTSPMSLPEPQAHEEDQHVDILDPRPCQYNPYLHVDDEAAVYSTRESIDRLFSPEIFETEINYRCMRCRNCSDCRNSERVNEMSLREEKEQFLIDDCVSFDPEKKILSSGLPFVQNPDEHLFPNRHIAECILKSQLKITADNEQGRNDVIAAHEKLRSRGFVKKLSEMDKEAQDLIDINGDSTKYYIPWRMQWKPTSLSSPGRMVFDASSATPKGKSLNCILAKGENRLSKLFHVLLKFRGGAEGFTADISMAYNNVWLKPEFLKYQLYLWKEDLDPNAPTEVFVVRTLIYGVRPSGNLMMAAFKLIADHCRDHWPEHQHGATALSEAYVDDLLHATRNKNTAKEDASSLLFVLGLANMSIKGFTFSGHPPPPEVSADGKTVGLLGMVWEPDADLVSVDAKPVFFGRVRRGKLPDLVTGDLKTAFSSKFTKRTVLSKMASLFDPMGLLAPLTLKFKLSFSAVCEYKTGWDEALPVTHLDEWVEHLKEIQAAKQLKFPRSMIPPNAAGTDFDVIISADASQWAAACSAHVRVPLVGGGYHVQLLAARTKITKDLTIPKAEMRAMTMAAGLGHVLRQQLGEQIISIKYVTDSSIALCQLNLDSRPMETLTRNCVIEVRRLTDLADWYHIDSASNVADIATRTASLPDVGPDSAWQKGKDWMYFDHDKMPLRTVSQIVSSSEAKRLDSASACNALVSARVFNTILSPKVRDRYKEFNYAYDPNKYGWAKAVRVMGYVCKFVKLKCPMWAPLYAPPEPPRHVSVPIESGKFGLSRFELRFAQHYFYYMATQEVKQHTPLKLYKEDTFERYGILFYAGRILDGHQVDTPVDKFIDMEPLSFVKPVADRYSPIAYSVMIHAHASIKTHRTASATLTESRSMMYIFQGRSLANQVREMCQECKVYKLKLMEVEMAPLHPTRLTIAPPFFISQVDLAGPFSAHSEHNLRAVVKVWLCVFKCTTSCAVTAHVITKYTTAAVLSAYTRFAKNYGHPGLLLIDQGTQLMSACDKMQISVYDLTNLLNCKFQVGVEHRVCPARAHNYQGMVERSIAEIKRLLYKVTKTIKLDIMGYETAAAWICNDLNNLPIALGSRTENLDNLDVITPSRLLLGRNNKRAMSGYPRVDAPSRIMKQQDELYDLWWDVWKKERLADFIPQPNKWRANSTAIKVGDIVAFVKEETGDVHGRPIYKVGRVTAVEHSVDGLVRTCSIEYKNASNPTLFQTTRMSVRHIAIIHSEGDLDLVQQLNVAARAANLLYFYMNSSSNVG